MPRPDVIAALEALSDDSVAEKWRAGERTWPHLDDVVHWLIDDTGLDLRRVTVAVDNPFLFRTDDEARLLQSVVDLLVGMIDDLHDAGAAEFVRLASWPDLRHVTRLGLAEFSSNQQAPP